MYHVFIACVHLLLDLNSVEAAFLHNTAWGIVVGLYFNNTGDWWFICDMIKP